MVPRTETARLREGLTGPAPGFLPESLDIAVTVLDRALPFAGRISRLLALLTRAGFGSGLLLLVGLAIYWWPLSSAGTIVGAFAAVILLAPAALLTAYRSAFLRYVAAADRITSAPVVASDGTARLVREFALAGHEARTGVTGMVNAARRLMAETRTYDEQIRDVASLATAANPAYIAVALLAALLVILQTGAAIVFFFVSVLG